jgi:hypothetical protein
MEDNERRIIETLDNHPNTIGNREKNGEKISASKVKTLKITATKIIR